VLEIGILLETTDSEGVKHLVIQIAKNYSIAITTVCRAVFQWSIFVRGRRIMKPEFVFIILLPLTKKSEGIVKTIRIVKNCGL